MHRSGVVALTTAALLTLPFAPDSLARPGGGGAAVPVPTVEGPIEGGLRGGPQGTTYNDPADFGYLEREYFISGTATSYEPATAGQQADYKTRIYTLRPADPKRFNGTVIVEWNNVSGTIDASPVWYLAHEHLIREGYAFVGVTAQKVGQDGGPLALKLHDPVRYGSLTHPGDDWSWDIYSQAGQALLRGEPRPLGDLRIRHLIAVGQSQSGGRLGSYLRQVHRHAGIYDGVIPMTAAAADIPDDVGPVLWVNSQSEARNPQQPDSGQFKLWEIAGAPHFTWWGFAMGQAAGNRNTRPVERPEAIDRDSAAQYGERGGGPCPQQFMPDRYAYGVAIHQMNQWVRSPGRPADSHPRIQRDSSGALVTDEHGNVRGGYRLPPIDVPVATYRTSCGLFGETIPLAPHVISALYADHGDYVRQMEAAVETAVRERRLLPADAAELLEMAEASNVGRSPILLAGL